MRKSVTITLLCIIICNIIVAQKSNKNHSEIERPKLVVGIIVDQMRWDYLYRYYNKYKTGGFKRLLNEGFSCENSMINYIPTVTAIGHTRSEEHTSELQS